MTVMAGLMVTGVTRISGMTWMSSLGRIGCLEWFIKNMHSFD